MNKLSNITATCCNERLSAPGRSVECGKCHTVFQVREMNDGKIVLTTTPGRMQQRTRAVWWHRVLARLPVIGRRFRDRSIHADIQLDLP